MIQYLQVKSKKGCKNKFLVFRERTQKFSKRIDETYIPKKESLMIYGMNASGKTKEIKKVWKSRRAIWAKDKFITISANYSLSEWVHLNIRDFDKRKFAEEAFDDYKDLGLNLDREIDKQYVRLEMLREKAKGAIVFLDDADRITGKKLEITKDIMRNCKRFIATASDETAIDKTLMNIMNQKKSMAIDLGTESSYDATNILIAVFIIMLFTTGQHEMAMLVMAARYMTKGKGN